jgi:GMP synthase-like glutamine amidotransferase
MTEKLKEKVLLSALDNYGGHPFSHIYDTVSSVYGADDVATAHELVESPTLIIWGGQDISATIYNQVPNERSGADVKLSLRDQHEVEMALKAMELGIPIIGICRGAQLMCALTGGILVQDVDNHAGGYHEIVTNDERSFRCPSLHHQMMYPWTKDGKPVDEGYVYLAWCPQARSSVYHGEPGEQLKMHGPEPEVLWFPKTKSLCIQSHPEFIDKLDHPFVKYTLELTEKYIFGPSS